MKVWLASFQVIFDSIRKTYLIILWVKKYIFADMLQELGVVWLQYDGAFQKLLKCDDEFVRISICLQWRN